MRKQIMAFASLFVVAFMVNVIPASAQTNWVEQFLKRYKPSVVPLPPPPSTASPQALAQMINSGQLPITVGDIVSLILQNNLDIGVDRLNPFLTRYQIEPFYLPFEPTLNLGVNATRNTVPTTTAFAGAVSLSQLTDNYTAGFSQALETGTTVGVNFSMLRLSSNNLFNTYSPSYTGAITYSFSQHLLKNYGRAVNTHQIRVAQNNEKISEVAFEKQVSDLVTQAEKAYWDLVFTAEDVKIKQRSMDLAQKTLSDNQIQVNIGTMAPIDLVQAESDVANRKLQLVTSTYTQAQTQDQVKKLITSQSDPGMLLAKLTPLEVVRQPSASDVPSIEEAIRIALENRPEMQQAQLTLQNKDIDVDYTKHQLLPTVDVLGSYTQNGLGGVINQTGANYACEIFASCTPIAAPGGADLGNAFRQLFGYGYTGYSAGFNVQIPLSNRAALGDNARAATDRHIAERQLSATAQQIALDVRNAMTQIEMNRAQIEAAQRARELAELKLDAEQKKFDLGASTIRFVLEEQRNVAQSQTDEISALVNYTKALVDFDHATGMTLKKNSIQISKALNPTPPGN